MTSGAPHTPLVIDWVEDSTTSLPARATLCQTTQTVPLAPILTLGLSEVSRDRTLGVKDQNCPKSFVFASIEPALTQTAAKFPFTSTASCGLEARRAKFDSKLQVPLKEADDVCKFVPSNQTAVAFPFGSITNTGEEAP